MILCHCSKKPIIFDVMAFIRKFGESDDECILGGRHKKYSTMLRKCFTLLKASGAELVFICDGSLVSTRIDVWCRRRNDEYKNIHDILYKIDAGQYKCSNKSSRMGCYSFVNNLLSIAEEYGTVIVATEHDCDSIAAKYATENDALAIVSADSDYLIFEGQWQLWDLDTMDLSNLTVKRFNREALIMKLGLSRDQMKVFATVVGNDYTKNLSWRNKEHFPKFESVADFCRSLPADIIENEFPYWKIAKYIAGGQNLCEEWIETVKSSIASYSIDFQPTKNESELDTYASKNVLMHAILKNTNFQYKVNYILFVCRDDVNGKNFLDKIFQTLRRLSGVILYPRKSRKRRWNNRQKPTRDTFHFLTKRSRTEDYELKDEKSEFFESMII